MRLIFILIPFYACGQNHSPGERNIHEFVSHHFINDLTIDIDSIPKYVFINLNDYEALDEADKKQKFRDYVRLLINVEHRALKEYSFKYEISAHAETDKALLANYRLIYNDTSNVYYMICGDKIITHFILDSKNRIISFAPNVFTTHNGRVEPFMLDSFK